MSLEEIIKTYTDKPNIIKTILNIKERFKVSGINVENVSFALIQIMFEVDKISKLRQSEKKQMTINVLNKIVEDVCPGDDTQLEAILKGMIPALIDNINDVKLNFKWCSCIKI